MQSVDTTQLIHAIGMVKLEVAVVSVLGSSRTLEAVRTTMITHDEGVGISSIVESIVVARSTIT